ncbi:MAG TPA: hypothetical protein VGQ71_03610 [Terriglobales bacterium]|nr:hypothetical protein [Terriglobales bacterium]
MYRSIELQSVVGLASALVALLTTWLTYQAASRKAIQSRPEVLSVTKLDDSSVQTKRWNIRRWRIVMAVVLATYILVIAIIVQEAHAIIGAAIGGAVGLIPWLFIRTVPPSRVYKRAELELGIGSAEAFRRCTQALAVIGARIARIDAEVEPKVVVARTGVTWRSLGDIISITVSSIAPERARLLIESDSISPAAIFDFGSTANSISRIKSAVFGGG